MAFKPPKLSKLVKRAPEARAKQTGTSYTSNSNVPLTPADYNEAGSNVQGKIFDPAPEVSNLTQAIKTYTQMYRGSVSVRMGLRAGLSPVVGGDYYMEPFSMDPNDLIISEFIHDNFFRNPTTPFKKIIRQITNESYKTGFDVHEIVLELREWSSTKNSSSANRKQYTMLRKLAPRPSSTISAINYDQNGGPISVDQNAIDPQSGSSTIVTIPINKCVIFPFEEDGGDLFGNPILRPALIHWSMLEPLYKIDAIQKERHAIGIPDINLLPGYTAQDKAFAHVIGRNLRTNERAYVVRNNRIEVGFLELKGHQLVNVLASAEYHDTMILKAIMVQFLNMGVMAMGGGGRSTGATAMDMFLKAMRYVGESICDQINTYVIPQLVAYNFPTDNFPKLKVRNIGEVKDLQMWSAAMSNLIGKGAIEVDEDTENFIREQVDMPKRTTPRPITVPGNTEELINASSPTTDINATSTTDKTGTTPTGTKNGTGKVTTGNVGKSASSGV